MMRIPLQAFAMVSAVRSFPMSASIPRFSRGLSPSSTRFFSTADGPDTSVVETCTEKIKEALGTDKVTVTGKCCLHQSVSCIYGAKNESDFYNIFIMYSHHFFQL